MVREAGTLEGLRRLLEVRPGEGEVRMGVGGWEGCFREVLPGLETKAEV